MYESIIITQTMKLRNEIFSIQNATIYQPIVQSMQRKKSAMTQLTIQKRNGFKTDAKKHVDIVVLFFIQFRNAHCVIFCNM